MDVKAFEEGVFIEEFSEIHVYFIGNGRSFLRLLFDVSINQLPTSQLMILLYQYFDYRFHIYPLTKMVLKHYCLAIFLAFFSFFSPKGIWERIKYRIIFIFIRLPKISNYIYKIISYEVASLKKFFETTTKLFNKLSIW